MDHTRATKCQLQEKLLELGALISGLGDEPVRQKAQRTKPVRESPVRSPGQRDWRNMYTMSEVVQGLEGPLPPIMENKTYPRKTLECVHSFYKAFLSNILTGNRLHELEAIIADDAADTTGSPDIGPPPISQFVDEDPIKVDLPVRPRKMESDEHLGLDPVFSVNLEQRRKRKDSIGGQESRRISQVEPEVIEKEITNPMKTGAKRKLSVRDDDDREVPTKAASSSPDDFKFTRVLNEESRSKAALQPEKASSRETREIATVKGATRDRQTSSTATPAVRKVLSAKSVNNSPRKSSKPLTTDSIKSLKPECPTPNPAPRPRGRPRNEPISIKPVPEPAIKTSEVKIVNEIPVEQDIFSRPLSRPPTRTEPRETPPVQDVASQEESSRPSRRSRPSVSYAEPNLRVKMRRPTSEFVDAVAADAQPDSVIKIEDQSTRPVKVKTEPESENQRKTAPVDLSSGVEKTPVKAKAPTADPLPSSITTHRKRRESILSQPETETRGQGSAIAALLAEKRRAKADARDKELKSKEAKGDSLDIYDFKCSSPEPQGISAKSKEKAAKPSRRHTAIIRDTAYLEDSDGSDIEAWKGRRQRSSTASAESEKEGDGDKALRKSTSTAAMTDPVSGSRAERVAARRRSMML